MATNFRVLSESTSIGHGSERERSELPHRHQLICFVGFRVGAGVFVYHLLLWVVCLDDRRPCYVLSVVFLLPLVLFVDVFSIPCSSGIRVELVIYWIRIISTSEMAAINFVLRLFNIRIPEVQQKRVKFGIIGRWNLYPR